MGDKHNNRRKEELRKARQAAERAQQSREGSDVSASPSQGNREEMSRGNREEASRGRRDQ